MATPFPANTLEKGKGGRDRQVPIYTECYLSTVFQHRVRYDREIDSGFKRNKNNFARHSEAGRRQGRQRKRWEDSIREWTGLEFAKSQKAVENGEKWRKMVVKSSVVTQRPSRLMDR